MKRTATTFLPLLFLFFFTINTYSSQKKTAPSLTMKQIANATLFIDFNGEANKQKVKLINGHYERRKKGSDTLSVDLTTWVKFTDLDKDGSQDAAVIFVWSKGGEEIFYELAALLNKKRKPVQVSSADLGDRVVIQALDVSADTVFLNMLTRGKGDANCCPTLPVKLKYLLESSGLTEQTDYVGLYRGKAIRSYGVREGLEMSINSDSSVSLILPAIDLEPTVRKTGKWYKKGDGSLLVDFTEWSADETDLIYFRFLNGKLTSMFLNQNFYWDGDLEFERVSE
ncbi:MAG: hypothetical protein RBG1_1C00001G0792 [candidate division Zixibacteria bacterium RBG-1]|nr:MAG: hypothetical protein RBG1_1C00001G0792 [candidate division Zixibacteria bacterium RBG-1]OGC83616.1 MAG: hypothetical protein A2V73_06595 [candidate division Zixibacteria bacterium RBG_19FT_COMBO_42_43]